MRFRLLMAASAAMCALGATTFAAHAEEAAASTLPDPVQAGELIGLRAQELARRNIYEVRFPSVQTARRAAITFHDALLGSDFARATLTLELDDEDLARLRRDGYAIERADAFLARRDATLRVLDRA